MTAPKILALLLSLPPYFRDAEPPAQREARLSLVADAVVKVGRTQEERAFLLATAHLESHFAAHIHRGDCRAKECDGGRARSLWQVWRSPAMTDAEWAALEGDTPEATEKAAAYALQLYRGKLLSCGGDRTRALRAYATGSCTKGYRGEATRLAVLLEWERKLKR